MLAPVLLMLVIPRMMKNLDPESQKVCTFNAKQLTGIIYLNGPQLPKNLVEDFKSLTFCMQAFRE